MIRRTGIIAILKQSIIDETRISKGTGASIIHAIRLMMINVISFNEGCSFVIGDSLGKWRNSVLVDIYILPHIKKMKGAS